MLPQPYKSVPLYRGISTLHCWCCRLCPAEITASAASLWRQLFGFTRCSSKQQRRSWALYSAGAFIAATSRRPNCEVGWKRKRSLCKVYSRTSATAWPIPLQLAVATARLGAGNQQRLATSHRSLRRPAGYKEESGRASLLQLSKQLLALPDAELTPFTGAAESGAITESLFADADNKC